MEEDTGSMAAVQGALGGNWGEEIKLVFGMMTGLANALL